MIKTVIAGAVAEAAGWRTVLLGPTVSIEDLLEAARREKADLVGVSYRLTPETGERPLGNFAEAASDLHAAGRRAGKSPGVFRENPRRERKPRTGVGLPERVARPGRHRRWGGRPAPENNVWPPFISKVGNHDNP